MAEFSDDEKNLLRSIPEESELRTSLSLLREAAEKIWMPGGPRVIRDYTDHGIPHSKRIAFYAAKLLRNSKVKLTREEMYLLLASIYLHDIGMQCDVIRNPEVKDRAEELGANFSIEFSTPHASEYTIGEQKAIRKNHQYLSIAWIDHANQTGKTLLGSAAKTIPLALVDDLMDICKHHTSLAIDDCPENFRQNPNGRKRFIAAILRISDELDIDVNRVAIETVQTFNLDPGNEIFWWLHNRTTITVSENSLVLMQVWLHPYDLALYKEVVQIGYIDKFIQKNQPVFSVLAKNKISIVMDSQSAVKASDRYPVFPTEIYEALQALKPSLSQTPIVEKQPAARFHLVIPGSIYGALSGLLEQLEAIKKKLADPNIQPVDCDQILVYLHGAEQSYRELHKLLSDEAHNPDFATAVDEFRPLRYKIEDWIRELRSSVAQFRNSCPPEQPKDQQLRETIYAICLQPLDRLLELESLLPVPPSERR